MKTLGIETSCDETAVAIVDGKKILSSIVASQHEIHSKFGGVVPELASRRHVEAMVPLLFEAFEKAHIKPSDLEGVAATRAPGLIGALLVGLTAGKALAYTLNLPFIGVNHLEGHINAPYLTGHEIPYPHIGLIVSGGHTSLYLVEMFGKYRLLGATRDDAAGEAFDKVARLLNLGYPGGPIIDKKAKFGNIKAYKFKTPKFRDSTGFDFSFSGIKTAVMHEFKKMKKSESHPRESGDTDNPQNILDLIASFQFKVIDILTKNAIRAAKKNNCHNIVVAGGVAANSFLRKYLSTEAGKEKIDVYIPPIDYCTDNAAMIAFVGEKYLNLGKSDKLSINASAVEEIGV